VALHNLSPPFVHGEEEKETVKKKKQTTKMGQSVIASVPLPMRGGEGERKHWKKKKQEYLWGTQRGP